MRTITLKEVKRYSAWLKTTCQIVSQANTLHWCHRGCLYNDEQIFNYWDKNINVSKTFEEITFL